MFSARARLVKVHGACHLIQITSASSQILNSLKCQRLIHPHVFRGLQQDCKARPSPAKTTNFGWPARQKVSSTDCEKLRLAGSTWPLQSCLLRSALCSRSETYSWPSPKKKGRKRSFLPFPSYQASLRVSSGQDRKFPECSRLRRKYLQPVQGQHR